MHKTLQGARVGARLTRNQNRQRWGARFFLLALLLTLSLTSLKQTASATCFEECQQAYSECLITFPTDPTRCEDRLDACLIGCM